MADLAYAINDAVDAAVDAGGVTVRTLATVIDITTRAVITTDSIEAEAGPDASPVQVATDAAGGLIIIPLVLILCGVFIATAMLILLRNAIKHIPIAGSHLSDALGGLVSLAFRIIQDVAGTIEAGAHDALKLGRSIFHAWLKAELRIIHQEWSGLRSVAQYAIEQLGFMPWSTYTHDSARVQGRNVHWLRSLQRWVKAIDAHVTLELRRIWRSVAAINHDLRYVNHELGRVWSELGNVHAPNIAGVKSDVKALQAEVHSLTATVHTLQRELNGLPEHPGVSIQRIVRDEAHINHVAQRVTDLQRQVDSLPRVHGHPSSLSHHQAAELSYSHWVATHLAPLMSLAPFTAVRLANLSALEDNPCQCEGLGNPRLPNLGDVGLDAIVADLVLKGGI